MCRTHRLSQVIYFVTVAAVAIGCARREVSKVDPSNAAVGLTEIPVEPNRDLDILFVIDNSGSMTGEQNSLTANFPKFIEVLETIEGGLPNVHIGIVSTDVGVGPEGASKGICSQNGDAGKLQFAARPPPLADPTNCPNEGAVTCTALDPGETFIKDILLDDEVTRERNYNPNDATLAERFSCMAKLGICGCGFEQPLEAMKRALDPGVNPGFLRENAFLAVIFITDEDDCSIANSTMMNEAFGGDGQPAGSHLCFQHGVVCDPDTPLTVGNKENCRPRPGAGTGEDDESLFMKDVDAYAGFLRTLKPHDQGLIIVAEISGTNVEGPLALENDKAEVIQFTKSNGNTVLQLEKRCQSNNGVAAPAIRLNHFTSQFPARNQQETICKEDLTGGLQKIADLLVIAVGNPCVAGNIDLDPVEPKVQYDCIVSDVRNRGTENEESSVLPQCSSKTPDASEIPCWYFEENNPECASTSTGLELVDVRPESGAPVGTKMRLECVLAE